MIMPFSVGAEKNETRTTKKFKRDFYKINMPEIIRPLSAAAGRYWIPYQMTLGMSRRSQHFYGKKQDV